MLIRLTEAEVAQYAPWAYELAVTPEYASYSTYRDGIKTREDFFNRAQRSKKDEELILFRHEGCVCGWIQWYALKDAHYAQTVTCLIAEHQEDAIREFCAHVADKHPGYTLDIGIDGSNVSAARALENAGFTTLERSVNHTLFFTEYQSQELLTGTSSMQQGEEEDFRKLHNAPDMYWSAERILADQAAWNIYLHREHGKAVAALMCQGGDWPEIFAIFFEDDVFRAEIYRSLMAACLNDLHNQSCIHMTYFEDDERALPVLSELGFRQVGRYMAYRKEL